jgi:hypothetical protein
LEQLPRQRDTHVGAGKAPLAVFAVDTSQSQREEADAGADRSCTDYARRAAGQELSAAGLDLNGTFHGLIPFPVMPSIRFVEQAFPNLTSERLVLTLPPPAMAPEVTRYYVENREHLEPWIPAVPQSFYTELFWSQQLDMNRAEYADGRSARFSIFLRDLPNMVGNCNFTQIAGAPSYSCALGFSLSQAVQGKGRCGAAPLRHPPNFRTVEAGTRWLSSRATLHATWRYSGSDRSAVDARELRSLELCGGHAKRRLEDHSGCCR